MSSRLDWDKAKRPHIRQIDIEIDSPSPLATKQAVIADTERQIARDKKRLDRRIQRAKSGRAVTVLDANLKPIPGLYRMKARRPGDCHVCHGSIAVNMWIVWDQQAQVARHEDCQ